MSRTPELRELNKKVTAAIFRAEHLSPGVEAELAFGEVSLIEEEIARLAPADSMPGALARRGAITGSLSAGDWLRALMLAEAYLAEPVPHDLAQELAALRDEASIELSQSQVPDAVQVPYTLVD